MDATCVIIQDLREQIDKQQEQIKKLKKALKIYAKRLKSTEGRHTMSVHRCACVCCVIRLFEGVHTPRYTITFKTTIVGFVLSQQVCQVVFLELWHIRNT